MNAPLPNRRELLGIALALSAAQVCTSQAAQNAPTRQCIRFRDGRRIAYAEYGNPAGTKIAIYHHGLLACRLEAELLLPALALRPEVRLIAFDRPGVGGSDAVASPSFRSWATDLAACADALSLERFGLVGTSGGTPFMLASAIELRDRVTRVSLACPVAEWSAHQDNGAIGTASKAAQAAPHLTASYLNALRRQVARSSRRVVRALEPLTPAERRRFDDPEAVAFAAGVIAESLRCGANGAVGELQLLARPWGLCLANIAAPVALFHGSHDRRVPPWMSESLSRALPRATVRISPGDGHFSLIETSAIDILDAAIA